MSVGEIGAALVPCLLLVCGGWLCIKLRAFPFLHPFRTLRAAGGTPESRRALWMALGGTLGVGNIAGVGLALALGGAGSIFWMWVCALLAMFIKYAEVTLALRGRHSAEHHPDAPSLSYLLVGEPLARWLGVVFCLCGLGLTLFLGGMIQSKAIASVFESKFGIAPVLTGVFASVATFGVISGGGKRISGMTLRLIPTAAVLYAFCCLLMMWQCREALPEALSRVFREAFSGRAATGGCTAGWLVALRVGCQRGLLSNEAGCGTAPMAHATATSARPEQQGVMGMAEVAVDTLLLCSLTALSLLCAFPEGLPTVETGLEPVEVAFTRLLGAGAGYLLAVLVFLFAFGTVICWGYYGEVCMRALFGGRKAALKIYPFLLPLAVFLGALLAPAFIWSATDLLLSIMVVINLLAVFRHRRNITPPPL